MSSYGQNGFKNHLATLPTTNFRHCVQLHLRSGFVSVLLAAYYEAY